MKLAHNNDRLINTAPNVRFKCPIRKVIALQIKSGKSLRFIVIFLYLGVFIYMRVIQKYPITWLILLYIIIAAILMGLFYVNLLGLLGNYFYAVGDYQRAEKYLKKAMKKETTQPTVYLNYGIILLFRENYDEALKYFEEARSRNKSAAIDKNLSLTMGSCYIAMGKNEEAIQELEALKSGYSEGRERVLNVLAYAYLKEGNIKNALSNINLSLEKNPSAAAAYEIKGLIYYKLNDYETAKEALLKALEADNALLDGNFYLGLICEQEGDTALANKYFLKASACKATKLNSTTKEEIETKLSEYRKTN